MFASRPCARCNIFSLCTVFVITVAAHHDDCYYMYMTPVRYLLTLSRDETVSARSMAGSCSVGCMQHAMQTVCAPCAALLWLRIRCMTVVKDMMPVTNFLTSLRDETITAHGMPRNCSRIAPGWSAIGRSLLRCFG